jgi:hypothetical protein
VHVQARFQLYSFSTVEVNNNKDDYVLLYHTLNQVIEKLRIALINSCLLLFDPSLGGA